MNTETRVEKGDLDRPAAAQSSVPRRRRVAIRGGVAASCSFNMRVLAWICLEPCNAWRVLKTLAVEWRNAMKTAKKLTVIPVAALALLGFSSLSASARIICNADGDCWHVQENYAYRPRPA